MMMEAITIALADDEALFRKGMRLLLEDGDHLRVIMEASNGIELLENLERMDELPDVLMLDLKMPQMDGIEAARLLKNRYPQIRIIVLSTHFSRAFVINMIELGAAAYLPKNTEPTEVVETIKGVMDNGFHYNKMVMSIIRDSITSKKKIEYKFPFKLTDRESEILQLICQQYTTPEIAEELYISPRTVDGHRNNLLSKLGCKNVAGLVVHALQYDLVRLDRLRL